MVSDERALATWLAGRPDAALAETLAARGVAPSAAWHDFFDAAESLLDAASVDRALVRLPRSALTGLVAAPSAADARLAQLALVDDAGIPYASVSERVAELRSREPAAFTAAPVAPAPVPADERHTAAAAERAFTTAGSLADVLLACLHAPFARTGAGSVSAAERKRLLDIGALRESDDLEDLLSAAAMAGLAVAQERQWEVTTQGERWLEATTATRWTTIANGFRASLPSGVHTPEGGFSSPETWTAAYPLDPDWPARAARLHRVGQNWGLLGKDGTEFEWTASLRRGEDADASALVAHLPAEIDRVYLQADLTAIAPGPLAPSLDLRLRGIAMRESRAQASTYRFTAESLGAGMTEGETAGSIRAFLTELSLTGIPQPLEYLIESTAARHGLVRVRADEASARTRIESTDAALRETIAIDQALRPLGLLPEGDALVSRVTRDAVYWSLADARYPVVALDEDGAPEPVHRRATGIREAAASTPVETYARLIAALRSGHGTDGEEGWLGRELEQAVRARSEIVVVVRMPDGAERTLTLEASGLGGGRLRGRDRAADIERTLPVSSIVSVRPV
ncbi:helicase-associated domain-containing protein [Microbacterium sp. CFH 31415]|uniref:helicase-associated domain-containing protein n=1 Tax=Microbacterium sp. CFH 31415 TaxID=2921732 RepID=UPI001F1458BA|nr:helicase-associated domain-containing protein [Microbacterium sp. CFH 31415]MCH6230129.1 helicase-associated domain-containing protein [Microbacterium sp. CFH 31415]